MEKEIKSAGSGWTIVLVQLALTAVMAWLTWRNIDADHCSGSDWALPGTALILILIFFSGYLIIPPNRFAVLQFMGVYKGTIKTNGFIAKNPFWSAAVGSSQAQSYQPAIIEVNDKSGAPIQIAIAATYRIKDTYLATYAISRESWGNFVQNQFDVCTRELAKKHSYNELTGAEGEFAKDLEEHLSKGGIEVLSAKIVTLNYAESIGGAMLQKQTAQAMSEARKIIVENAVGIAEDVAKNMGFADSNDRIKFTSNLILILCSERSVTPTINVGEN